MGEGIGLGVLQRGGDPGADVPQHAAGLVLHRPDYRGVLRVEHGGDDAGHLGCFRQDRSFMGGTQNFQAWLCKFSCSARHAA